MGAGLGLESPQWPHSHVCEAVLARQLSSPLHGLSSSISLDPFYWCVATGFLRMKLKLPDFLTVGPRAGTVSTLQHKASSDADGSEADSTSGREEWKHY